MIYDLVFDLSVEHLYDFIDSVSLLFASLLGGRKALEDFEWLSGTILISFFSVLWI